MDGGARAEGVDDVFNGRRGGKMAATRSFVLCEVLNGLAVLPGPALFVSVLIGLVHKRRCTAVISQ